jgi:NAD(P)-dependent dehydrogenase (short-subunit alcohol dehydrogenase family)
MRLSRAKTIVMGAPWQREIDTNLTSVYRVSRAIEPHLVAAGGGANLSTASSAGVLAAPKDAAYVASKAGLIILTRCMALDGASEQNRANCICPGFVNTPMFDGFPSQQPDPEAARAKGGQVNAASPTRHVGRYRQWLRLHCVQRCGLDHRHGAGHRRRRHGRPAALRPANVVVRPAFQSAPAASAASR